MADRTPRATPSQPPRKGRDRRIPQWTPIRPSSQVVSRSIPLWRSGSQDGDMLLEAVQANDIQALTDILESGVGARQRGRGGETPLTRAVRTGSIPMATTLLEFDADPNDADPASGMTPLHYACSLSMRDVMSPPLSSSRGHGAPRASPHPTRRASSLLFVNLLLGAGASVNAIDLTGRSPLFFALTLPTLQAPGHQAVAPTPRSRAVSASRSHEDGWESVTAMTAAPWDEEGAERQQEGVQESGREGRRRAVVATATASAQRSPTALFDAPSSRAVVASLLRAGADVNVRDHTGVSPLRWLCMQVHVLRRSLWQCQRQREEPMNRMGPPEEEEEEEGATPTLRVSLVKEMQRSDASDPGAHNGDADDDDVLAWSDDTESSVHSATKPGPPASSVALATVAVGADPGDEEEEDLVMDDSGGDDDGEDESDGNHSGDLIYHGRADSARSFVHMANAMLAHAQSLKAMLVQAGATMAGRPPESTNGDSKERDANEETSPAEAGGRGDGEEQEEEKGKQEDRGGEQGGNEEEVVETSISDECATGTHRLPDGPMAATDERRGAEAPPRSGPQTPQRVEDDDKPPVADNRGRPSMLAPAQAPQGAAENAPGGAARIRSVDSCCVIA